MSGATYLTVAGRAILKKRHAGLSADNNADSEEEVGFWVIADGKRASAPDSSMVSKRYALTWMIIVNPPPPCSSLLSLVV